MSEPIDRHGKKVTAGISVRITRLDPRGLSGLEEDDRQRALSMIGETFVIEEVDEYGHPCVFKKFEGTGPDNCVFHSITLDPDEFEVVDDSQQFP